MHFWDATVSPRFANCAEIEKLSPSIKRMCPQEQDNSGNIYLKKGRKKDRKENKTTSEERLNESRGCYNLSLLEGQ